MLNTPPRDRAVKAADVTRKDAAPLNGRVGVPRQPEMSVEAPGYEEYLRRQNQPRKNK